MACEVTSTPASGKYRIVTDYVADPGTNAILMKVAFTVDKSVKKAGGALRLYLRFDPTVNGNGGGGGGNGGADSATTDTSTGHTILVASDPNTATNAANRDYAQPVYAALDAPVRRDDERLRRDRERRAHPARRLARADHVVRDGEQRQRRPDRPHRRRQEATTAAISTSRSRSASARARRQP